MVKSVPLSTVHDEQQYDSCSEDFTVCIHFSRSSLQPQASLKVSWKPSNECTRAAEATAPLLDASHCLIWFYFHNDLVFIALMYRCVFAD